MTKFSPAPDLIRGLSPLRAPDTGPGPGQGDTPLVTVSDIAVRFPMPSHFLQREKPVLHALRGVDVAIEKGEAFCVVGESGCGKTTLGRVIMGLLAPSAGEIRYGGARIDDMDEGARRPYRRKMQMIFQNPYASLNPRMTVRQTLAESLRYLGEGLTAGQVDDKIAETMESVGANVEWGKRMPHEFSGGQRQRISIARALITDPEFIVADEPISALDVSIQAQVLNLLTKSRRERGLTYFFITHDLSVVEHFGDRVAVMYLGEVVELAPVAKIFDAPQHPYTRLLLSAIPRIGGKAFEAERAPGEIPTAIDPPKGCAFASRCPLAHDRCRVENPVLKPTPAGTLAACHAIG